MLHSVMALTQSTVLISQLWSPFVKFLGATHNDTRDIHDCTFLHMAWQRFESFTGGTQVKGYLSRNSFTVTYTLHDATGPHIVKGTYKLSLIHTLGAKIDAGRTTDQSCGTQCEPNFTRIQGTRRCRANSTITINVHRRPSLDRVTSNTIVGVLAAY